MVYGLSPFVATVSEMIPPPVPASSGKLGACVADASSSDESILEDLETAQKKSPGINGKSQKVCEENSY